tara:strand:- start:109172 stop:110089 length:918 start_codon:yes stop_codon:yes gene_type:complete
MKALALFLFRLATGGYLVAWSCSKLLNTPQAIEMSDKLYSGLFSTPVLQNGLAFLGAVLGIFVALGFVRGFSYTVQTIVLAVPVAAMGYFVSLSGFDLPMSIEAGIMVLPSFALFLLSLASLVWLQDDFLTLDRFIGWRRLGLAREAADKALLAVPAAAAVAMAAENADGAESELAADKAADDAVVKASDEEPSSNADIVTPDDAADAAPEPELAQDTEPAADAEASEAEGQLAMADEPEVTAISEGKDGPLEAAIVEEHTTPDVHDEGELAETVASDAAPAEGEIKIDPGLMAQVEGHETHTTH